VASDPASSMCGWKLRISKRENPRQVRNLHRTPSPPLMGLDQGSVATATGLVILQRLSPRSQWRVGWPCPFGMGTRHVPLPPRLGPASPGKSRGYALMRQNSRVLDGHAGSAATRNAGSVAIPTSREGIRTSKFTLRLVASNSDPYHALHDVSERMSNSPQAMLCKTGRGAAVRWGGVDAGAGGGCRGVPCWK
jgi:hypothetical protein